MRTGLEMAERKGASARGLMALDHRGLAIHENFNRMSRFVNILRFTMLKLRPLDKGPMATDGAQRALNAVVQVRFPLFRLWQRGIARLIA